LSSSSAGGTGSDALRRMSSKLAQGLARAVPTGFTADQTAERRRAEQPLARQPLAKELELST